MILIKLAYQRVKKIFTCGKRLCSLYLRISDKIFPLTRILIYVIKKKLKKKKNDFVLLLVPSFSTTVYWTRRADATLNFVSLIPYLDSSLSPLFLIKFLIFISHQMITLQKL